MYDLFINYCFSEDNLEATLDKSDEFLSSFNVATSSHCNWDTRMGIVRSKLF